MGALVEPFDDTTVFSPAHLLDLSVYPSIIDLDEAVFDAVLATGRTKHAIMYRALGLLPYRRRCPSPEFSKYLTTDSREQL